MRLIDAITRVRRPAARYAWEFNAPCDPICESLDIQSVYDFPEAINTRLRCYPIYNWMCTDEHVGLDAIYWDDEPAGCSYRSARKNYYEIEWISAEIASAVRTAIIEADKKAPAILDPDQDIGDDYTLAYPESALVDSGFYLGEPATPLVYYDLSMPTTIPRAGRPQRVKVEYKDPRYGCMKVAWRGEEIIIPNSSYRMAFNCD